MVARPNDENTAVADLAKDCRSLETLDSIFWNPEASPSMWTMSRCSSASALIGHPPFALLDAENLAFQIALALAEYAALSGS